MTDISKRSLIKLAALTAAPTLRAARASQPAPGSVLVLLFSISLVPPALVAVQFDETQVHTFLDAMLAQGVVLKDGPTGTTWEAAQ